MTASGGVTVLYSFTGAADGAYPYGALVQGAGGSLLGTTSSGGAATQGPCSIWCWPSLRLPRVIERRAIKALLRL